MKYRIFSAVLALTLVSLGGLGHAGAQGPSAPPGAPPADQAQAAQEPGVGRVSLIQGDAATQRGDNGQWAAAVVNTPVVNGDNISTGDQSRAEVQLDYADLIRLDQHTQVKVVDLANNHLQIDLADGLIDFSILRGAEANVEVDTPNMAVLPTAEGEYRIEVASPTETRVIVRAGGAQISTPQGSTQVNAGQMITIEGAGADAQYHIDPAPEIDEWDQWNLDRNQAIVGAQSWSHTDQYYTGSQDLDQNGQWVNTPDYGQVWQPNVEEQNPDWVPYRDGSWCDEPYYGWTWVSSEPWGWAPYHYGRWFLWGNRWSWWPGVIAAGIRPLWGPAWVSFLGLGAEGLGWFAHFGLGGFGFGSIGWLPLGPLDIFHPWWGRWGGGGLAMAALYHGGRDFARIGSNLGRAFTDARVRGGLTAVDARTFAGGRIAGHLQPVSLRDFRQARTIDGRLGIEPTREAMSASHTAARASAIPGRSFSQTRFFTSGAAGQRSWARAGGAAGSGFSSFASRPAPGSMSRPGSSFARPAAPYSRAVGPAGGSMARGGEQGGWQRFAQSPGTRGGVTEQRGFVGSRPGWTQPGQAGGWQRFDQTNRQTARQPLNLNRPFMTQRNGGSGNATRTGGYAAPRSYGGGSSFRGAPFPHSGGYSAPRSYNDGAAGSGYGYGAPRSSGGYNAPRTFNAPRGFNPPRGASGAPRGFSAPRQHFSAPRGGGGFHGGGGHSGGGGGHHGGGGGGHHGGGHGRH